MRIVHVTPSYWPAVRYGGPIRSVHGLCAGLAELGHDVRVLTTNVDGPGVSDVPLDRPVDRDGVAVRYFPTGLGRRLYRAPGLRRALREAIAVGTDVVHLHSVYLWPTWAGARTAERAGVPDVVSPRGMLVRELIGRKSRVVKTLWIALVERRTLARAAAIHATSTAEVAAIRGLGLDLAPIIEVPNGVVPPPPEDPTRADDDSAWNGVAPGRRLLYLGRVNWKKGLDRLIRALAHERHAAVLAIAGNDEEGLTPQLERIAAEAGVADRVRFVGPVEGGHKWRLLRTADLLVLPSLSENFGIVVLEALGVGTPVIVTPEVGAAEIVRRYEAGLVAAGDPQSLAAAVASLLADPALRRSMGERGRRLAHEHCTWPAVARRMSALYAELSARQAAEREMRRGRPVPV